MNYFVPLPKLWNNYFITYGVIRCFPYRKCTPPTASWWR